ncbi:MAG TPA: zinc-dependent alcohol dehydrogenase family protein [Polyangiaceae bacterium]|jgi:propanol-preferring alcohol dehydrogenase|nr:zinc-dependent alcohol dehydrogenase family protein [Polyangiaceae bacterium]
MRAMLLRQPKTALELADIPDPEPGPGQLLLDVRACALCRTDLHVIDGELDAPKLPLVLGHQIIGTVVRAGAGVEASLIGSRMGVPWLGWTCGRCRFCTSGRENLCDAALFTGYTLDGGYAERVVADRRYCFAIDASYPDEQAAPLLCAGLIGYRSLRMCGDAEIIGIYGFGAAAHIVAQVIGHQGRRFGAFVRRGDDEAKRFAESLGAAWACDSDAAAPERLDAAIVFAPAGPLVVQALANLEKGGVVVCGGIHMSDIPSFPYALLWGERSIRSVANLTRQDGEEFMALAPRIPIRTSVTAFALDDANEALASLRAGRLSGAAVVTLPAGRG